MSYLGEIMLVGFDFEPIGWAFCDGRLLSIAEHDALFIVIGTTYGGDGQETFALPDLRGRAPIHWGSGAGLTSRPIGEMGGVEEVTLTVNQIPAHNHYMLPTVNASSNPGTTNSPAGAYFAKVAASDPAGLGASAQIYGTPPAPPVAMAGNSITGVVQPEGGSQPHYNMQPYLVMNYIISLYGEFPSQS